MHLGCYKSMATTHSPMTTEMALQAQISLLSLRFSALFSAPAHGKPPVYPSCPRPLSNSLGSTWMFAPPFIPLCGPESPRTHSRRLLVPYPTVRLAWLLTDIFPCSLWEWDTANRYPGYSDRGEKPLRHLWGQLRAQHRKTASPCPAGAQSTRCFSGVLQRSSAQET